jgi:hypothetical protein
VKTLNQRRDALGLPRYDFAEADMPMIVTQRGIIFLEGSSEQAPPGTMIGPAQPVNEGDDTRRGQPTRGRTTASRHRARSQPSRRRRR